MAVVTIVKLYHVQIWFMCCSTDRLGSQP